MTRMCALVLLMIPLASAAQADDGMRCDSRLVTVGMSEDEVVGRCGPPTSADRRQIRWRTRYGIACTIIDTWVYDRGVQEFVRTVTFTDGTLRDVAVGDYGRTR